MVAFFAAVAGVSLAGWILTLWLLARRTLWLLARRTLWLLARRSVALCEIARNGHLSGETLARYAHETLGETGATKYRQPYVGRSTQDHVENPERKP